MDRVTADEIRIRRRFRQSAHLSFDTSLPGPIRVPVSTKNLLLKKGSVLKKDQVIADGPSTHEGIRTCSLGRNVLVAYMPWEWL
ncbi:MAG: hypothetical protein RJR35_00085 [Thermoanaerobacterales bacterium]|nr:hypothetical protein [Thermoanaerobacterales bacterium]